MPVESATYVSQLDTTKPAGTDFKSEGDDHLRVVKTTLVNSFQYITGPVTVSHTDLNSVPGKAAKAGDTYTGTHDFTAATLNAATLAAGDNSTKVATTSHVQAVLGGLAVTANGLAWSVSADAAVSIANGQGIAITNAGAVTVTLPASPSLGHRVGVCVANGRADNVIARNGQPIMGLAEDLTIDATLLTVDLIYINTSIGWQLA